MHTSVLLHTRTHLQNIPHAHIHNSPHPPSYINITKPYIPTSAHTHSPNLSHTAPRTQPIHPLAHTFVSSSSTCTGCRLPRRQSQLLTLRSQNRQTRGRTSKCQPPAIGRHCEVRRSVLGSVRSTHWVIHSGESQTTATNPDFNFSVSNDECTVLTQPGAQDVPH